MAMNNVRFKTVYDALPNVVQKIYEGVPSECSWDATTIHAELIRRGIARDISNTKGGLRYLVDAHLVLESSRGFFTRARVRGAETTSANEPNQQETETQMATQSTLTMVPVVPVKADPIDQLAKLSARVMVMSGQLKELANDIETAALDITEQMNVVDENTQKLKQLQTILKGLV